MSSAPSPTGTDSTTLAGVSPGQSAVITDINTADEAVHRLAELGLVPGRTIAVLKKAPLGDPMAVRIMNYELCLRRKEASAILVDNITNSE